MRYPEPVRLAALAALALAGLPAGCVSPYALEQPPRATVGSPTVAAAGTSLAGQASRGTLPAVAPPRQYRLVVREVLEDPAPCLAAELIRVEPPEPPPTPGPKESTAPPTRRWRFHPEFFLLPLAPVRTGGGLAGAGGLVVGFVSTYGVRWAAGTSAAGVCAIAGCAAAAGELITGGKPTGDSVLSWAKAPWEWGWDSASHARLWGVKSDTDESLFDRCLRFAFDYSGYSLSPIVLESRPSAAGAPPKESKSTERPPAEAKAAPCAIKELTATVRANRDDSETILLAASPKLSAGGPVFLPLKPALDAFCYDDKLTLELAAFPVADPTQRVSAEHVTQVSRWRKPTGPHIRWLAPGKVVPGETAANPVSQKELVVRIRLRADTPDAPITMWQIKQDGKVRGGAFAAPGRPDLGRDLIASAEAKFELGQPGERTILEVHVEASDTRKSSSTATFVFSPSP